MIDRWAAAAVALVFLLCSVSASAENRVALVVGNGGYDGSLGALTNPPHDAELMAETLQRAGFDVVLLTDGDQKAMKRAVKELGERLRAGGPDTVGLFYYAGHGFQSGGENWLVPVGAEIASEADADLEALAASAILRQMEVAGNRVNIVILDACRNTPVTRSFRSDSRGLARISAPQGSFIAYATAPGDVAADGSGENSPYTAALAAELLQPGVPIEVVFRQVRERVLAATGHQQTPWDSSSLTGAFYFVPTDAPMAAPAVAEVVAQPAPAPAQSAASADKEMVFWQSIQGSEDPALYQAYLDTFPEGTFANLARVKIAALSKPTQEPEQTVQVASADVRDVAPAGAASRGEQLAALPPESEAVEAPEASVAEAAAAPVPAGPTADDIKRVQRRLKVLGYAVGGADGEVGPRTRAAIRAFQERAGLAVDGEVSEALLSALMSESAPAAPKPKPAPAAQEREVEAAALPKAAPAGGTTSDASSAGGDALFWQSIQTSTDPADFEDYLARYPDGAFTSLAKRRLAGLTTPPPAPQPTPVPVSEATAPGKSNKCPSFAEWTEKNPGVVPSSCKGIRLGYSPKALAQCAYRRAMDALGCERSPFD